jgi:hypothetical protein
VPSLEPPSTKISSVPAPITGVRLMAASTLPASLRVGTTTVTVTERERAWGMSVLRRTYTR